MDPASTSDERQRWVPLEANPQVMNQLIDKFGVSGPLEFVDVFGLEDELLNFLPQPVTAMVLLFPITENYLTHERSECEALKGAPLPSNVYFTRQTIGNACGTIALIHVLANNTDKLTVDESGMFSKMLEATQKLSPEEKAKVLEGDAVLSRLHASSAQEGDTVAPSPDEDVNLHFVALVCKDNRLYELDGRKPAPVDRGATTNETFLKDAVRVCKDFMQRDPSNLTFSMLAFTSSL